MPNTGEDTVTEVLRDASHRDALGRGVGTPHVRHRLSAAGLLRAGSSFLIAAPTAIKLVNLIGTLWRGHLAFEAPMLFAVGFLVTFLFGGPSGARLASTPPLEFQVSDKYLVVAAFPPHAVQDDRLHLCRHLLLVSEDDRPDAGRVLVEDPLLADVHRIPT
jgi:hypothetical protein